MKASREAHRCGCMGSIPGIPGLEFAGSIPHIMMPVRRACQNSGYHRYPAKIALDKFLFGDARNVIDRMTNRTELFVKVR